MCVISRLSWLTLCSAQGGATATAPPGGYNNQDLGMSLLRSLPDCGALDL